LLFSPSPPPPSSSSVPTPFRSNRHQFPFPFSGSYLHFYFYHSFYLIGFTIHRHTHKQTVTNEALNVMISGAPASGKGTQCHLIADKVYFLSLSTAFLLHTLTHHITFLVFLQICSFLRFI